MEERRCVNCGGSMTYSPVSRLWTCDFCESTFEASDEKKEEVKSGDHLLNPDMFAVEKDLKAELHRNDVGGSIKEMKYCLDELKTSGAVEQYMIKTLINGRNSVSMADVNTKLMEKTKDRYSSVIESSERIIFYCDKSLFGKGKDYFIVTDKRVLFFTKKEINIVDIADINMMRLDTGLGLPSWLLDDKWCFSIGLPDGDKRIQGALIALICLISFEQNPGRGRIRIV